MVLRRSNKDSKVIKALKGLGYLAVFYESYADIKKLIEKYKSGEFTAGEAFKLISHIILNFLSVTELPVAPFALALLTVLTIY